MTVKASPELSKRMEAVSFSNYLTLEGKKGTKNYKKMEFLTRTPSNNSTKLIKLSAQVC